MMCGTSQAGDPNLHGPSTIGPGQGVPRCRSSSIASAQTIGRHRGAVVAIWVLLLLALVGAAGALGDQFDDSFSIPGTESQQGQDLLAQRFGLTGAAGQVLFTANVRQDHRLRRGGGGGHHW